MKKFIHENYIAIVICFIFFIGYLILGIVRQNSFWSGYDLAVIDQAIWKYSQFTPPISTNHAYAFTSILWDHVELLFILIAPLYWIIPNINVLIALQAAVICLSGIPIFLLAKKYKLHILICFSLLFSYLSFYGIQNAIWADVHSLIFGIAFLAWFIYSLDTKKTILSFLFFFLAILSKEDLALLTLVISFVYFMKQKDKHSLLFILISAIYLFSIFYIYFPHFVPGGYRFQSKTGLLHNINLTNFYNTSEKKDVLFYSLSWFGFLPLLAPLYLLPALADLGKYFVIANSVVTSGQGLFGHYRSSLGLLLVFPTILALSKFKRFNKPSVALYICLCAILIQYHLHLPLSYLSKKWFWKEPTSVHNLQKTLSYLPPTASVVSQINVLPHVSHRKLTFLMWPEVKSFTQHSPCKMPTCQWFHWAGNPQYMIVDTSTDWDARYWLTNRKEFIAGMNNLEKAHIIIKEKQFGESFLYKVLKNPSIVQ